MADVRTLAIEVVLACAVDEAYANLLLPVRLRESHIVGRDAALATELTYGTLRRQGTYDTIIAHVAGRAITELDSGVLATLRVGAHQLLNMRIPAHAAVNETITSARPFITRSSTGFINAILRRVSERSFEQWCEFLGSDISDSVSPLRSAHPEWIIRALASSLRHEDRESELEALLNADNAQPKVNLVDLSTAPLDDPPEGIPDRYSRRGIVAHAGDPHQFARVRENLVRVQDEGSQLVAEAFASVAQGTIWLDMCAGPGGKAALLARIAHDRGVHLVANEVSPHRADLVRQALAQFPGVEVRVGDGRKFGIEQPNAFDAILLDAPCTGLGALRRRPESRWRKQPADVSHLAQLQEELLDSACSALRPGGVVGYVTCSPHTAETHAVVQRTLSRHPEMSEINAKEAVQEISRAPIDLAGADARAQLWPHRHGTDAMFLALLHKSAQ